MSNTNSDQIADELYQQPDVERQINNLQERFRAEQRRRTEFYDWLDEDKKAEFINGEIVVHSPVVKQHADATFLIAKLLDAYAEIHELGYVAIEKTLIRLERNDFEPDVCFWDASTSAEFDRRIMFFPAPTLVVEVLSDSTAGRDRGIKKLEYGREGVAEYWIVDAEKQQIERYVPVGGSLVLNETVGAGDRLVSLALPGFSVPLEAAFDRRANRAARQKMEP